MVGFGVTLGTCSAFTAEIWGILVGLQVAWDKRIRHFIVESDSAIIISCLQGNDAKGSKSYFYWHVILSHTYREGNICADWLANWSIMRELGVHLLDNPPGELGSLLLSDVSGAVIPRLI